MIGYGLVGGLIRKKTGSNLLALIAIVSLALVAFYLR